MLKMVNFTHCCLKRRTVHMSITLCSGLDDPHSLNVSTRNWVCWIRKHNTKLNQQRSHKGGKVQCSQWMLIMPTYLAKGETVVFFQMVVHLKGLCHPGKVLNFKIRDCNRSFVNSVNFLSSTRDRTRSN